MVGEIADKPIGRKGEGRPCYSYKTSFDEDFLNPAKAFSADARS